MWALCAVSWRAKSNIKPPGGILHHILLLFSGRCWGWGNCWVCHPLSVPSVSSRRVVTAWGVPIPPPCAGGLPIWEFPLGPVGPTHWNDIDCDGATAVLPRYYPRVANQDIPHQQQHMSSFRPFQSDVIFKVMFILVICALDYSFSSLDSNLWTVTLPLQASVYLFPHTS